MFQSLRPLVRYNNILKLNKRNLHGFYFTVQKNTNEIEKGEKLTVYEGPELEEIMSILNKNNYSSIVPKSQKQIREMSDIWQNCIFDSSFKAKYFSLLPFNVEDRHSFNAKKKFVLKMELYPDTKYLKFTCAMISGLQQFLEPINDIVPITPGDFKIRHQLLRSKPPHFVDIDMLYANRKIPNVYCFDIHGTWIKSGMNHPVLSLENTYNESNWFDHVYWFRNWL